MVNISHINYGDLLYINSKKTQIKKLRIGLFLLFLLFFLIVPFTINIMAQIPISSFKSNNTSFNFKDIKQERVVIQFTAFDRLLLNLNSKSFLFEKETFLKLENIFKNDVVYYSMNSRLKYDVSKKNYSNSKKTNAKDENSREEEFLYDLSIYKVDFTLDPSYSFYINFINGVERNQFFHDMNTKHNNIYTNEFSILDFQSAQADQYINGSKVWGGTFIGMFGVLMLMPRSVTKWEDGYIDDAISNLNRAFSEPPVWDEDHWEINYIGHPYAGSLYYNTIRAQGGSMFNSFLFSAFISTGWEYIYEGVAEQPSIQDLIVTPVAGAVLGELIHQATIGMKKNGFSVFEAAFVTVFNPMYVILNGYK